VDKSPPTIRRIRDVFLAAIVPHACLFRRILPAKKNIILNKYITAATELSDAEG